MLAQPGEPADLAVIASHGRILRGAELAKFGKGVINMHPSLLPLYRGAAPAEWQILRGELVSGVTAILTTERVDSGPVLAQRSFALPRNATRDELLGLAAAAGVPLLHGLLLNWEQAKASASPQQGPTSSAPKVSRELSRIVWRDWTADEAERRWRALGERFGGLETSWNGRAVKFVGKLRFESSDQGPAAGEAIWKTSDPSVLRVGLARIGDTVIASRLTVAGGKEMSAADFARGYLLKAQTKRFE